MRLNWRFFALCVVALTAVGMLPKWLKPREAVEAAPVAKSSPPIQSFAGVSTDDPALQSATKNLVSRLQAYAQTNDRLKDVAIEGPPGLRVWTPEPNVVEVIMPFSGTQEGAARYFRMRARAKYPPEASEMKLVSIAIYHSDTEGKELGLADPVLYY